MKKPNLLLALVMLFVAQSASAQVSVVSEIPYPEKCVEDDYERTSCTEGNIGKWVLVYNTSEMDAKHASFNERLAKLQAENGTLRSQVDQREKDIKTLSNKADLAETRYLELIKLVNELSGKVSPLTPRIRTQRTLPNSK